MTTLNDTLNAAFSTFENTLTKAEEARDKKVADAKAAFATAENEAKSKLDKVLVAQAEKHFDNGGTLDEFAEAYGKSVVTTRNHLRELGVDVPVGKKGAKSKYDTETQREIAQAWYEGNTKDRLRLALDKDVTEATMRTWAINLGIFEPKKREAKVEAVNA